MDEWYLSLLDDLKAISTEYGFTSRWTLIEGRHELGKRILEENKRLYGDGVVLQIAKSLNISERTLQYAIQFATKYPDLNMLPVGKNVTWSMIIKELLPDNPIPKEKKEKRCPHCGGIL